MEFKSYLKTTAQSIDWEVEKILIEFLEEVKKTNLKLTPFALGLISACKGGKRVRGVLVKLGYEIATPAPETVRDRNDIIKIGAAFEILHAALLIHDDIEDKSPIRRGRPSLYQALGGDHYGISQAINIGDIGLYLPIKIITDSSFLGEDKLKAIKHLSQIIINTGWGQILDVELGESGKGKGESEKDQKEFINLYKTAKYTIAGPLQMGAILGGADNDLIGELGKFGGELGIAFQIRDDILDEERSSQDYAEALGYISKGKKVISKLTKDKRMSKLLEQMAEYLVERRK